MTALWTLLFRNLAASAVSLRRICALISSGAKSLPALGARIFTLALSSMTCARSGRGARRRRWATDRAVHDRRAMRNGLALYGICFDSSATSLIFRPMKRLTEKNVFSGLTTAWRFAICGECGCGPVANGYSPVSDGGSEHYAHSAAATVNLQSINKVLGQTTARAHYYGFTEPYLTDKPVAGFRERDDRRRGASAFRIRDDGRLASLHGCYGRVRGA